MPPLAKYREIVERNASLVSSIEGSLRSISYLLVGRFEESEIVSESLFGILKIIGFYHDSFLSKVARKQSPKAQSLYNRYTEGILKKLPLYRLLAYLLAITRSFEVFVEILAFKRAGKELQTKVCLLIESFKFICRLTMFHLSGKRMVQRSSLPIRDYDLAKLKDMEPNEERGYWKAPRTDKEHLSVSSLTDSTEGGYDKALQFMLSKAMIDPAADPLHLLSKLKGLRLAGEYLFIARPLIYILTIQKYGALSYKPWALSIILEVLSMSASIDPNTMALCSEMTVLDKETLSDRTSLIFYYLLRSPFYDNYSKPRITALVDRLNSIPLLNIAGSILNDYTPLWENYHFYSTGF